MKISVREQLKAFILHWKTRGIEPQAPNKSGGRTTGLLSNVIKMPFIWYFTEIIILNILVKMCLEIKYFQDSYT